jgi:hypothetical protein
VFLSEFGVECALAIVKSTTAGEVGRKRVAPVGAPTDAEDDKATAERQGRSEPLIDHKVAEFIGVFGAHYGDPASITSGWDNRCDASVLVVCGGGQENAAENYKQV